MMDEYKKVIHHLPNTKLTPEVLLHRTLEKLPRIKGVVVVIQWDDDSVDCDWSQMKVSALCMAAMQVQHEVQQVMHPE